MMLRHSDSKDIWITEFGWSSYAGNGGVGENTQKEYLQNALALLELWDFVPTTTWYNLIDTDFGDGSPICDKKMNYSWSEMVVTLPFQAEFIPQIWGFDSKNRLWPIYRGQLEDE